MEIKRLLEEFEALGEQGTHLKWNLLPGLKYKTIVDADDFFKLLHQIDAALPAEVTTAGQLVRDSERIVREAHEERAKIIDAARDQARLMISNDELVKAAEREAEETRKRANIEADAIKAEAEAWAKGMVERLESYVARIASTLDKAKRAMESGAPTRVEVTSQASGPANIDS
jgi:vacuolar-type H+-ATPase subunit H